MHLLHASVRGILYTLTFDIVWTPTAEGASLANVCCHNSTENCKLAEMFFAVCKQRSTSRCASASVSLEVCQRVFIPPLLLPLWVLCSFILMHFPPVFHCLQVASIQGVWRVFALDSRKNRTFGLSTARALGDLALKKPKPLVISNPTVHVYTLHFDRDAFLVSVSWLLFESLPLLCTCCCSHASS